MINLLSGVVDVEEGNLEEELVDKPGTTIGTKFSVLHFVRIPFLNEMWFLTVDPFIRVSVFIAKLSERIKLLAYPRGLSLSRICPIL